MKITPEELKQAYRNMSDQELLGMNRDELTDAARGAQDQELERRGLQLRPNRQSPAAAEQLDEPWVCAGVFRTADEAQIVRGLLDGAGIPVDLEQDLGDLLWMGSSAMQTSRVMVPESMLEEARRLVESKAVEEELAAQAEADPLPAIVLARYEDGVFKPLEPVDLEDGAEVEVHLPATAR